MQFNEYINVNKLEKLLRTPNGLQSAGASSAQVFDIIFGAVRSGYGSFAPDRSRFSADLNRFLEPFPAKPKAPGLPCVPIRKAA